MQALGRTRGSISVDSASLLRQRTESTSVVNRIRSDSTRTRTAPQTELAEDAEFLNHAIESQGMVAQLPPVMVRLKARSDSGSVLLTCTSSRRSWMTILCVVLHSSKIAFSHPVPMVSGLVRGLDDNKTPANTQIQATFEHGTGLVKPSTGAI